MRIRLYDPGLVRRLRRAAKERTRRGGRRSAKGKWWRNPATGRASLWWIWLAVNAVRVISQQAGNPALWKMYFLTGTSLALAGVALSRARKLAQKLTTDGERIVLLFYPISAKDFFSWATLRFAAGTTWILILTFVVYFLTIDATTAGAWAIRIAAPFAEWLIVLCAAFALVRHSGKYPRWLPLTLYVAAAILLFAPEQFEKAVRPLAYALPTGWLNLLLTEGHPPSWTAWVILAAIPILAALVWQLWFHEQRLYCLHEVPPVGAGQAAEETPVPAQVAEVREEEAEGVEAEEEDLDVTETPREAALPIQAVWQKQKLANWGAQITEYVWQRQWLQPWDWQKMPPLERAAGWFLNPREKGEAQFLFGSKQPAWSERWKVAVIATAVAFAVILLGVPQLRFVAVLAAAVAVAVGLPILGGNWPASHQGRMSGKFSPIFGCYPLSYWKAGWTMYKLNLARTLAWLPLGLLLGVLGAKAAAAPLPQGCWMAVKVILLFLMMMPILLAGKFSKGTNDTSNLRLRLLPLLCGFIVILLVLSVLIAVALIPESGSLLALASVAGVGIVSFGTWAAYGYYYDRAQVDLLREQR